VVKNVAEKIYAAQTKLDVKKMAVDPLAVLLPTPKAGEGKALRQVLNELDIKTEKKEMKSPWILALSNENRLKIIDIHIREGFVPRVIGMGAKDAVYLLENAGLQVRISGIGRVVSQSIQPRQSVSRGQTIMITLK
jgi:cell division protein FtsI (penicillin-binding protein 3)